MQELVNEFGITVELQSEPTGNQRTVWRSKKEMEEEQKKQIVGVIMTLMGENQESVLSLVTAHAIIDVLMGKSQEVVAELEKKLATYEVKCFEKDTWGKHPGNTEEKQLLTVEYLMAWCTDEHLAQIAIAGERKQKYIEDKG